MLTDDQRRILMILADPVSDVRGLVARERAAIRAAIDEIEEWNIRNSDIKVWLKDTKQELEQDLEDMDEESRFFTIIGLVSLACGLLAFGVGIAIGLPPVDSLVGAAHAVAGGVVGSIVGLWLCGRFSRGGTRHDGR